MLGQINPWTLATGSSRSRKRLASVVSSDSEEVPLSRKRQKTINTDRGKENEEDIVDLERQDQDQEDIDLEDEDRHYEREDGQHSASDDDPDESDNTGDERRGEDDSKEHEYSDGSEAEENVVSEDDQPVRSKRRFVRNTASIPDELNI